MVALIGQSLPARISPLDLEGCMSRALRFASGAALLSLVALLFLPIAPAAAEDDYNTCLGGSPVALDACTRVILAPRSTREQVGEGRGDCSVALRRDRARCN